MHSCTLSLSLSSSLGTSLKVFLALSCTLGSSDSSSITLSVNSQVTPGIIFSASDAMSSAKEALSNSLKLLVIASAAKSSEITFRISSRTSTSVAPRTLSNSIAKSGTNLTALFSFFASSTSCATTETPSSCKSISATSLKLPLITLAAKSSAITFRSSFCMSTSVAPLTLCTSIALPSDARVGTCEINSQDYPNLQRRNLITLIIFNSFYRI